MANEDTNLQNEINELTEEYAELRQEMQKDIEAAQSGVGQTQMHLFNIGFAAVMVIIGAILVYQTRKVQLKNGKKIAGWILLVLGIMTLIVHVVQLLF